MEIEISNELIADIIQACRLQIENLTDSVNLLKGLHDGKWRNGAISNLENKIDLLEKVIEDISQQIVL